MSQVGRGSKTTNNRISNFVRSIYITFIMVKTIYHCQLTHFKADQHIILNFWFDHAVLIAAYNFQVVDFKPQHSVVNIRRKPLLLATSSGWACLKYPIISPICVDILSNLRKVSRMFLYLHL